MELLSGPKHIAVNETTDGVAVTVRAVVVELASLVATGNVDLGEVTLAGDLDVLGGLHKVDTFESALGHHAGAVSGLGAVGHHLAFSIADRLDSWRSPQAEVTDAVEPWTTPPSVKSIDKCIIQSERTEGLALGGGRRAGSTVVITSLADLRLVGEVVGEVTNVPHW